MLTLVNCGSDDDPPSGSREQTHPIETGKSSSNIEYHKVGEVETAWFATEIGYYEYTDLDGRLHVCDIATNPRGGTSGVGLSCAIVSPTASTPAR